MLERGVWEYEVLFCVFCHEDCQIATQGGSCLEEQLEVTIFTDSNIISRRMITNKLLKSLWRCFWTCTALSESKYMLVLQRVEDDLVCKPLGGHLFPESLKTTCPKSFWLNCATTEGRNVLKVT